MVSARASGARGQWFESTHADQFVREGFCGVAKSVRRPPVKREIAGSSPAATANFAAGRSGSPGWSHNPSLAGSTPASATKVRGRSGRDEELRHRFSSGRGLVAWASAFQADDASSILAVRSMNWAWRKGKTMRVWYVGCALVRQTRETCSSHVTRSRILGW